MKRVIGKPLRLLGELLIFLILLEIALRLSGFIFAYLLELRNKEPVKKDNVYRIMCVGESTTALGGQDSYPSQLQEILNSSETGRRFSVINKGVIGVDTEYILAQLEDNIQRYKPDMVLAMMGRGDLLTREKSNPLRFLKTYKLLGLLWSKISESFYARACSLQSLRMTEKKEIFPEPANLKGHVELGWYSLGIKNYRLALDNFKQAELLDPNNEGVFRGLGVTYCALQEPAEARRYFEKSLKACPDSVDAKVGLGMCYQAENKYAEAEQIFRKILSMHPSCYYAYTGLGLCLQIQQRSGEAEKFFQEAIRIEPRKTEAYCKLGWLYKDLTRYSDAERSFRKALALNPGNEEAYLGIGWVRLGTHKFIEAARIFRDLIKYAPDSESGYLGYAICCERQGKSAEAEEILLKAIKINPTSFDAYVDFGKLCYNRGDYLRAIDFYNKAIDLNPFRQEPRWLAGLCYSQLRDDSRAEECFKKATEAEPQRDPAYFDLSSFYQERNLISKAEEILQQAVDNNPRSSEAYIKLGWLYAGEQDFTRARQAFEKAAEVNPSDRQAVIKALLIGKEMVDEDYMRSQEKSFFRQKLTNKYTSANSNLLKMNKILERSNIRLVCVQYPMCSIKPLEDLLGNGSDRVIFVDNEEVFKKAVDRDGYRAYFVDLCSYDFGHCTRMGNRLLAENIAKVISDFLNKQGS